MKLGQVLDVGCGAGTTHGILARLGALLTPNGHVHVLELVLTAGRSIARLLARLDRGRL